MAVDSTTEIEGLPHRPHRGEVVKVGPYQIRAAGSFYLREQDLIDAEVLVPLNESIAGLQFGVLYTLNILAAPLQDFGGVNPRWEDFLRNRLIPMLAEGKNVMAYCTMSHGRTGTLLASLISILEPETEDPIAAVRVRHCNMAVETVNQARAIFDLRGQTLPQKYEIEFERLKEMNAKK